MQDKEGVFMELKRTANNKLKTKSESNEEVEITEREKRLLAQYKDLCEENKVTIEILIQRLLGQEKGRE